MSNWLEAWTKIIKEQRIESSMPYGTKYARTLSTAQLKKLWDKYDGCDDSIGDEKISGEAIHIVLNERKEGSYCAV